MFCDFNFMDFMDPQHWFLAGFRLVFAYGSHHHRMYQGFGSGSGSVFNRASGSGSGSLFGIRIQEGKNDRQKEKKFMFWSVGWTLLWAAGFFCNLDILYGGLGLGKLQFLIKKNLIFFFSCNFFKFLVIKALVIKALDPDWIQIGSGSVLVSSLNLWIRIRIRKKWIRIRNTGMYHTVCFGSRRK